MARWLFAPFLMFSIACGPSLKQAQTNTEYYEQCYGADYDPTVTPDKRRHCWTCWLVEHSKGQAPERVRYAKMRVQQLSVDGAPRSLPSGDEPAPAPVFEHEYPRAPPGEYHLSSCDPLCNDRWASCNSFCEMKDVDCVAACESEFRVCVDGCP